MDGQRGFGAVRKKSPHLEVHGAAAAGDETPFAVDGHHARPIAAGRLVAKHPGLVELGDECAQLNVELSREGSGRQRGLALDV